MIWGERRGWNPQPSVQSTDALPVEPQSRSLEFQSKHNGLKLIPGKTERFLPLFLKESSVSGGRKPQRTVCPSGLGQVWRPGGLKRACEAEQPFEFQLGLDVVRYSLGCHENLLLPYKGTPRVKKYNPCPKELINDWPVDLPVPDATRIFSHFTLSVS